MKTIRFYTMINRLIIFALALQTSAIMPADAFFKKLGQDIKTGSEKVIKDIKTGGEKAISEIKKFGQNVGEKISEATNVATPKLIDSLQSQVRKLKDQFKTFGGRIITGNLPDKDKAAVFGTIISIVTLTGLVVGVSLNRITQQQGTIIENKVNEIKEKSASGIKGVFDKAKAQLQNLDDGLSKLKECLTKGNCTADQKKFLYGTAITVSALLALALGIGAGAFFYKKYKDKKELDAFSEDVRRQTELSAQQQFGDLTRNTLKAAEDYRIEKEKQLARAKEEAAQLLAQATKEEQERIQANIKRLEQEVAAAKEAERKAEEAEKARLEKLARETESKFKTLLAQVNAATTEKISAASNKMQSYFEKQIVPVAENAFIEVSTTVRNTLDSAKSQLQEFGSATLEMKEKIVAQAQEKFDTAKRKAQELVASLSASGKSLIQTALDQLFGIKLAYIDPALTQISDYTTRTINSLNPLSNIRLIDEVKNINQKAGILITDVSELSQNWQETLRQLAERTAWVNTHVRPTWAGGKSDEQIKEEAKDLYPLALKADKTWKFYPTFVDSVNALHLTGPGMIINTIAKTSATLVDGVSALNDTVGKFGKVLISDELAQSLKQLSPALLKLGEDIRSTFAIKPLLATPPATTATALMEAFQGYTWRVGTDLPNKIMSHVDAMKNAYRNTVTPALAEISQQNSRLSQLIKSAPSTIGDKVKEKLQTDTLKNSLISPVILARAIADTTSTIKGTINAILTQTGTVIDGLTVILSQGADLSKLINQGFGGEFINRDLVDGMDVINADIAEVKRIVAAMQGGVKNSFNVLPE